MDSFNFLKNWKTSTKPSTKSPTSPENPSGENESSDDDASFFDLEFAENRAKQEENEENEMFENEQNFNFTLNSSNSNESQPILIPSSDELFFKGQLVPLEQNSIVITSENSDLKPQLFQIMKSATKFRVFILGLRKSKTFSAGVSPKQSKLFFINFKVEDAPIVSLFNRDSSSRNQACVAKTMEGNAEYLEEDNTVLPPAASVEEKMKSFNSKEVVQKYLSKIKPLYVKVSKRYAEKLGFSGQLVNGEIPNSEIGSKEEKVTQLENSEELKLVEKNFKLALPAKLKVAYERIGKSRAATISTVSAVSSPPQRRDDSLLQQEDGIQSAIAHCKRSFTANSEETELQMQLSESNVVAECVQFL